MMLTKGSSKCTIQQGYWYTEVIKKAKKLLKVLKGAILSEIQGVKFLTITKRTGMLYIPRWKENPMLQGFIRLKFWFKCLSITLISNQNNLYFDKFLSPILFKHKNETKNKKHKNQTNTKARTLRWWCYKQV